MRRRHFVHIAVLTGAEALAGPVIRAGGLLPSLPKKMRDQKSGIRDNWFFRKRFGMFVHWGLYAIPAVHEQYQQRYHIPRRQYEQYARQWDPVLFDPEKWHDLMQEAGLEYLTFTTKHHDGFCMWETKQTSFNVMIRPMERISRACWPTPVTNGTSPCHSIIPLLTGIISNSFDLI